MGKSIRVWMVTPNAKAQYAGCGASLWHSLARLHAWLYTKGDYASNFRITELTIDEDGKVKVDDDL